MFLLFIWGKIQEAFWDLEACICLSDILTLKKRQLLDLGLNSKQVPPDESISNQVKFSPGNLKIGVLNS